MLTSRRKATQSQDMRYADRDRKAKSQFPQQGKIIGTAQVFTSQSGFATQEIWAEECETCGLIGYNMKTRDRMTELLRWV
jgi:hypothetical protein